MEYFHDFHYVLFEFRCKKKGAGAPFFTRGVANFSFCRCFIRGDSQTGLLEELFLGHVLRVDVEMHGSPRCYRCCSADAARAWCDEPRSPRCVSGIGSGC